MVRTRILTIISITVVYNSLRAANLSRQKSKIIEKKIFEKKKKQKKNQQATEIQPNQNPFTPPEQTARLGRLTIHRPPATRVVLPTIRWPRINQHMSTIQTPTNCLIRRCNLSPFALQTRLSPLSSPRARWC